MVVIYGVNSKELTRGISGKRAVEPQRHEGSTALHWPRIKTLRPRFSFTYLPVSLSRDRQDPQKGPLLQEEI